MAVFTDPDLLLLGLARTLRQRVLPKITDESALFAAEKSIEMIVNLMHRRSTAAPSLDRAQQMASEIRQLTGGEGVGRDASGRLLDLLREDSCWYEEDQAGHRARIEAENAVQDEVFDVPTDAALTAILRKWSGDDAVEGRLVGRAVGGYSKQTLFVDMLRGGAVQRQLVMRRDLPFAAADRSSVTLEYPLLRSLFDQGYPVAEPLLLEADPAILQTPFLLSERMPGRLYGNSLGLGETPDFDPEAMLGRLLAHLHSLDFSAAGLDGAPDSATSLTDQQERIDRWIEIYRAHVEVPSAALEIGLAWLRANAHLVAGRSAIVHGDVGFHNILIEHGQATALVDWELAHIANPVEDLAYASSYLARPDALIDHYVRNGGTAPTAGELAYCRVFGDIRNSVYGTVTMAQFNRGDHHDVSVLPIVLSSYWTYVPKLERELGEIIAARGFYWLES
ncbi:MULTISPECIES: phosphotransferase family protein [Sphingobium]|uniref:phosphotransferase family protein n=1 Tax=Sphingobium sp. MI1205 TaxID=407020 RepID=UPI0007705035|nr:phosphotransferase family protein [Sphingobium sp. MI1205]AMK19920.1 putative aminoglycoside phosphotransferase [Sphingobium sp. MI1205]